MEGGGWNKISGFSIVSGFLQIYVLFHSKVTKLVNFLISYGLAQANWFYDSFGNYDKQ